MTESTTIKAKFDVKCDRCGHLIHVGEDCVVKVDEVRGKAFFFHRRCPNTWALKKAKKPVSSARIYKPKFALVDIKIIYHFCKPWGRRSLCKIFNSNKIVD